jgi:hypothetical protein
MLEPYLSLNRDTIFIQLDRSNLEKIVKTEAIEGLEELPYVLPKEASIIVDDLDPGFSVLREKKSKGLRIIARQNDKRPTDQGLPVTPQYRLPSSWSRVVYSTSFGKYRQTLAVVRAGDGEKKAVFTADINQAGQWDLELHLPWKQNLMPRRKWGTYHLVVTDSNGDAREIEFDSTATPLGWSLVESVFLPEGQTTLTISNKTDGQFVVADAIRWSPSSGD